MLIAQIRVKKYLKEIFELKMLFLILSKIEKNNSRLIISPTHYLRTINNNLTKIFKKSGHENSM